MEIDTFERFSIFCRQQSVWRGSGVGGELNRSVKQSLPHGSQGAAQRDTGEDHLNHQVISTTTAITIIIIPSTIVIGWGLTINTKSVMEP